MPQPNGEYEHVSSCFLVKPREKPSGPFRWWSRRSCFVNCSWSTESTESTVSFSWATCSKRSPSTGISRRLSCLCWSCLFAANNLPCFNSCGHFQITIQWSVSVLQRTLQSWTIEDACDFLAMLPGQPLASGVDASRTMTFRRDKENKELLWTGFTNTSYLMYQQLLSFSFIFYDSLSFTVLFSVGDSRLTLGREAGAVRVGRASASWPTSSEKGVGDGEWKNIQKKNQVWTIWTSWLVFMKSGYMDKTTSTAQGGGGGRGCESRMAEQSHWWTERCLRSPLFLSLSLSFSDYLPTYLPIYLSIYPSVYVSIYLSIYPSVYVSIFLSI